MIFVEEEVKPRSHYVSVEEPRTRGTLLGTKCAMPDTVLGSKGSGQLSDDICAMSPLRSTAAICYPLSGEVRYI